MAAQPPVNLGNILADNIQIFRAFAEKSYRNRKKNQVRYFAYLLRDDEVTDGLSVGTSPASAVRHLETNEGYCSILVGDIHALPYDLRVRADLADETHAFICNLPLMSVSDEARERARLIGDELARKSVVMTCDPYIAPADHGG